MNVLVVKGVSDHADSVKDDSLHESASFALQVTSEYFKKEVKLFLQTLQEHFTCSPDVTLSIKPPVKVVKFSILLLSILRKDGEAQIKDFI